MNKSALIRVFATLATIFFLIAVFARYLILPEYLYYQDEISTGNNTLTPSIWGMTRYMIWAFSFKLAVFFSFLAVAKRYREAAVFNFYLLVGVGYLLIAYIPLPIIPGFVFGISGVLMSGIFVSYLLYRSRFQHAVSNGHPALANADESQSGATTSTVSGSDIQLAGVFFFIMATYTLCPLMGVGGFALTPEKMIQYDFEARANWFAGHLVMELLLAWFFLAWGAVKDWSRLSPSVEIHGSTQQGDTDNLAT